MFQEANAFRKFNSKLKSKGRKMYSNGLVTIVKTDSIDHLTSVDATVKSSSSDKEYKVYICFDEDGNVVQAKCTCPSFDIRNETCSHIAAVIYAYMDKLGLLKKAEKKEQKKDNDFPFHSIFDQVAVQEKPDDTRTSPYIDEFLNFFEKEKDVPEDPVKLYAAISAYVNGGLCFTFKIGRASSKKTYVIRNIDSFLDDVHYHNERKFGKELDTVLSMHIFDERSRKIIRLLVSFVKNEDFCVGENKELRGIGYGYNSYRNMATGEISLRGRYLDEMIEILRDEPIKVTDKNQEEYLLDFVYGNIPLNSYIAKERGHYVFASDACSYAQGEKYLYFMSYQDNAIFYMENVPNLKKFYDVLLYGGGKDMAISKGDMPSFVKYIYPMVKERTVMKTYSFNPDEFIIPEPEFEVYLDYPQDNLISCKIKAIYGTRKFDIFDDKDMDKRDRDEENEFEGKIGKYFNSFDNVEDAFLFHAEEDSLYQFLSETIPALHELSAVFISDELNKLRVVRMPTVTVGVSVKKDLLQLNLSTSDLSMKEVSEILSKYDRKKKYYRLKNGTFINMENTDINEMFDLKDALSLSGSDISKGKIRLPMYRALYIEAMSNKKGYDISYDDAFSKLLETVDETRNRKYVNPEGLKAELRPYQKDGVMWLTSMKDNGFGALLADDMGLGKTLQVITMLAGWKEKGKTLIVCPASLVYNWNSEIEKFMPSLPHRMIQGTPGVRKKLIESASDNEILLTSYQTLQKDIELYEDVQFSAQIIDEAQNIKNPMTITSKAVKLTHADYKIALTGTPIENRLSELWSIFDYMMPGFFGSYESFRKTYERPIVKEGNEEASERLNQMISPFILRRLKKDVLKDLPEKMEEVYYAPLEGEQKKLYEAEVQKLRLVLAKQSDADFSKNKIVVLSELTKLRQLCCNPGLLYEDYKKNSAKTDMCLDLITNAVEGGHKVLIFSQFTSMLDQLSLLLRKKNVAHFLLKGSTQQKYRANMVEEFQNDDRVKVFLISLKAGGTGLNLTAADIVIHYDPWWNTAAENQASDRAYRIGQTNDVTVYKLIMKDTIEERIIELQKEKNALAEKVLSSEGVSSASLSREELLKLL